MGVILSGCGSDPTRTVYASGFSFANYDYVIVAKPDADGTSTSLYGMDVELANLLTRYNMKVVGRKQFAQFPESKKTRTLFARMALSASDEHVLLTISFDDASTGRVVSSFTGGADGELYDGEARGEALENVLDPLTEALKHDKHLTITERPSNSVEN